MSNEAHDGRVSLFVVGNDYHLGDLLWLTAVLREYHRQRQPDMLLVVCPDRDISRILENSPVIDRLTHDPVDTLKAEMERDFGDRLVVHDLRPHALGIRMVLDWRRRLPWLYYRDLWMQPRGQWLATFLGLGRMTHLRPMIQLVGEDHVFDERGKVSVEPLLPGQAGMEGIGRRPYVVLTPGIGSYSVSLMGRIWREIKRWDNGHWSKLAELIGLAGYDVCTLGAAGQEPVPRTKPMMGMPIRKAAAVVDGAEGLVTGESGMWFVAAALQTPFVIVPWWLPRSVDWAAPMNVPHRLIRSRRATADEVFDGLMRLLRRHAQEPASVGLGTNQDG